LNLDYEYTIITRNRKINWSLWLYLTCRWSTLLGVIVQLMKLDASDAMNCETWTIIIFVFFHFVFQSATCLIILRVYALWERKRTIVVATFAIFLAHNMACVYVVAITHAHWNGNICRVDHIVDERIVFVTSYITDLVLLILMLFGVLRWKQARLTGGIWPIMYTQGLVYVVVAILAYTPAVTFLVLNLNEPMNVMFMFPSSIIMPICALRMHRGLVDGAALNGLRSV